MGFTGSVLGQNGIRPSVGVHGVDAAIPCERCPSIGLDRTADAGAGTSLLRGRGTGGLLQTSYSPTYVAGQVCTSLNHPPTPVNTYTGVLTGTFLAQSDIVELVSSGEGRLTRFQGANDLGPIGIGGISQRIFVFENTIPYVPPMPSTYIKSDRWVMSAAVRDSRILKNSAGAPVTTSLHNAIITPLIVTTLLTGLNPGTEYRFVVETNFSDRNTDLTFDTSNTSIAGGRARGALACFPQVVISQYVP
jgi:hypothetical protein